LPSNIRGIARSTPSSTALRAHAGALALAATANTRSSRAVSLALIVALDAATPPPPPLRRRSFLAP
jgi:hypothetical protein